MTSLALVSVGCNTFSGEIFGDIPRLYRCTRRVPPTFGGITGNEKAVNLCFSFRYRAASTQTRNGRYSPIQDDYPGAETRIRWGSASVTNSKAPPYSASA